MCILYWSILKFKSFISEYIVMKYYKDPMDLRVQEISIHTYIVKVSYKFTK